jgi:hypothetical protein
LRTASEKPLEPDKKPPGTASARLRAGSDVAIDRSTTRILLALAHPPDGEVLQFSGIPEIHFLFNPRSIRIDRCYAEL